MTKFKVADRLIIAHAYSREPIEITVAEISPSGEFVKLLGEINGWVECDRYHILEKLPIQRSTSDS